MKMKEKKIIKKNLYEKILFIATDPGDITSNITTFKNRLHDLNSTWNSIICLIKFQLMLSLIFLKNEQEQRKKTKEINELNECL